MQKRSKKKGAITIKAHWHAGFKHGRMFVCTSWIPSQPQHQLTILRRVEKAGVGGGACAPPLLPSLC